MLYASVQRTPALLNPNPHILPVIRLIHAPQYPKLKLKVTLKALIAKPVIPTNSLTVAHEIDTIDIDHPREDKDGKKGKTSPYPQPINIVKQNRDNGRIVGLIYERTWKRVCMSQTDKKWTTRFARMRIRIVRIKRVRSYDWSARRIHWTTQIR